MSPSLKEKLTGFIDRNIVLGDEITKQYLG